MGITVDDINYKASPSVPGVEKPLVRVQLNLLHMATDDELKHGLLSSLQYYGKVYQVRQIMCNGYFEGQLTVTLDPSQGYVDEDGKKRDSQPLQRMLYLEKWDVFAPAAFKGAQPICYYCRQEGHIRSTCPELAKRRCFGCGETGHTKRFCRMKETPPLMPAESESELLDNYAKDSAAMDSTTDEQYEESSEDHTAIENEIQIEDDLTTQEKDMNEDDAEDMEINNDENCLTPEYDQDPAESVLGSKWAPYDRAINMKVDDPAEMLNLTKVKDTTKAKSATVKRRLTKTKASPHNSSTKTSDTLTLKPIVPPTYKLQSSARRAQ